MKLKRIIQHKSALYVFKVLNGVIAVFFNSAIMPLRDWDVLTTPFRKYRLQHTLNMYKPMYTHHTVGTTCIFACTWKYFVQVHVHTQCTIVFAPAQLWYFSVKTPGRKFCIAFYLASSTLSATWMMLHYGYQVIYSRNGFRWSIHVGYSIHVHCTRTCISDLAPSVPELNSVMVICKYLY